MDFRLRNTPHSSDEMCIRDRFNPSYIGSYYEYAGDRDDKNLSRSILFDSLEYMDLYVEWGDE